MEKNEFIENEGIYVQQLMDGLRKLMNRVCEGKDYMGAELLYRVIDSLYNSVVFSKAEYEELKEFRLRCLQMKKQGEI